MVSVTMFKQEEEEMEKIDAFRHIQGQEKEIGGDCYFTVMDLIRCWSHRYQNHGTHATLSTHSFSLILKRFHISPHPHHNFTRHISRLNTFQASHSITQTRTQSFHHFTQHTITFIDSFTRPLNHKHKYQLTSTHH